MAADPLPPTKQEYEALMHEHKNLMTGVANVTLAWAEVENNFVLLLAAILNFDNYAIPAAMYFSLTGVESRLRMVDGALHEFLIGQKHEEQDVLTADLVGRAVAAWGTIMNTLNRLRKVRNKVAHGQIVNILDSSSSLPMPRLTAPVVNFGSFRETYKKQQKPGLSANDLRQSAAAARRAAAKVHSFEKIIRAAHAGNESALIETLAQLEEGARNPGI